MIQSLSHTVEVKKQSVYISLSSGTKLCCIFGYFLVILQTDLTNHEVLPFANKHHDVFMSSPFQLISHDIKKKT